MSCDYRFGEPVQMRDLFNGRLQQYGIVEKVVRVTTETCRVLIDERGNYLCVYANDRGYVTSMSRYGFQFPERILEMLSSTFNSEIYSEHEPEFYGCSSHEELDAWMRAVSSEIKDEFYEEVINFVSGKEHGLIHGTIEMAKGEIAKALVLFNPDFLLLKNKEEFLIAIEHEYKQVCPPASVTLNEWGLPF